MHFYLTADAVTVLSRIENAGHTAYIAGGTVRELIMNEQPAAYIIVTDASREKIKQLFRKRIDDYNKKSCITVIENKMAFDIFYPCDNSLETGIEELLGSFDFTINSVAYNPKTGIYDPYSGVGDIEKKIIRFTEVSQNMIAEKTIRMLRAVRYKAQLGFEIKPETARIIKKCSMLIKRAASTRVREELDKIIMSKNPGVFSDIHELGLLRYILPELDTCFYVPQKNKYHIYNVGEHIVNAVINAPNDSVVRWAALLHDIGKPECRSVDANGIIHFYGHHRESVRLASEIMRRLKMEAQLAGDILILIENHDVRIDTTSLSVKRMMSRTGAELFEKLLELQEADNRAKNQRYLPDKLNKLNDVRKIYQKVIAERHPYKITDLAVNGRDLNKLGFRPGHEIGDTLQTLLEEVFIDPALNNREYLIMRAKQCRKHKS